MKRSMAAILAILFVAAGTLFSDETELLGKAEQLSLQKKHAAALELLNSGLRQYGETENLLAAKFHVLLDLGRPKDALPVAIRRVQKAERKSPWHCIAVMEICLKLHDMDGAFAWLNRAVERGFLDYSELEGKEYSALRKDPRFPPIVRTIQERIGIGRPAKDFTCVSLSGEKISLAGQKGNVVLIDFWATWCPPCREGIVHLKDYYEKFKSRGFEIIGISLDEDQAKMTAFIERQKMPWRQYFDGAGWENKLAVKYGVDSIPATYLLDRAGNIVAKDLRGDALEEAVAKALTK